MTREYDQADDASSDAPPARWRLVLLAFTALLVGGVALVAALAFGASDPLCMRVAAVNVDTFIWREVTAVEDGRYYAADDTLPPTPFTLAVSGRSRNDGAVWGIWLDTVDERFAALITHDGYLSVDGGTTWREFRHIRRDDNTLCVHVVEGEMTLYVNNEVALRETIGTGENRLWGITKVR